MTIAFTLCSNNYLAQAKVLADSFLQYHPDLDFVIGLVDKKDARIDYSFFSKCSFVLPDEVNIPDFPALTLKYDVTELNTAVKPFYFQHFFDRGFDKVIYIDPDIMFFSDLSMVIEELNRYSVCLTPHILYPSKIENVEWELNPLQHGLFNLGFLALSNTADSHRLIKWWGDRTYHYCYYQQSSGYFVDQLWASLFPVFFDNVQIIKNPGLNAAYWNMCERTITKNGNTYFVNKDYPLVFFHFSSFNIYDIDKLSPHPSLESIKGSGALSEIADIYKSKLETNNISFYRNIRYHYENKNKGKSYTYKLKKRIVNKLISILNKF